MWIYKNQPFDSSMIGDHVGFVYLITNLENGRKYVGKKLFKFTRRIKGKGERKRKVVKDSDWQEYYGSCDELKEDVKKLGEDKFKREILYLCKTKGECNYLEAKEQFDRRVLESDEYYNSNIFCRIHKAHVRKMLK